MNKNQLIDAIAAEAKTSKVEAKKVFEALIRITNSSLEAGSKVSIVGFGTFTIVTKPERKGRNPKTGETIVVSSKNVVKFKPGTELARLIKK